MLQNSSHSHSYTNDVFSRFSRLQIYSWYSIPVWQYQQYNSHPRSGDVWFRFNIQPSSFKSVQVKGWSARLYWWWEVILADGSIRFACGLGFITTLTFWSMLIYTGVLRFSFLELLLYSIFTNVAVFVGRLCNIALLLFLGSIDSFSIGEWMDNSSISFQRRWIAKDKKSMRLQRG